MISALVSVAHICITSKLLTNLNPLISVVLVQGFAALNHTIVQSFVFYDVPKFWSNDPTHGILGYLASPSQFFYIFVVFGFLCGYLPNYGYYFASKLFSEDSIGNMGLMEPVVAQILGCLMGLDNIPAISTQIGFAVIISGSMLTMK